MTRAVVFPQDRAIVRFQCVPANVEGENIGLLPSLSRCFHVLAWVSCMFFQLRFVLRRFCFPSFHLNFAWCKNKHGQVVMISLILCWCKSAELWLLQDGQVQWCLAMCAVERGCGWTQQLLFSPALSWAANYVTQVCFICFRSNKIPDAYLMLWKQQKNIHKFLSSVHSLGQNWSLYSDTAVLCRSWLCHWTLPEDSFFTFSCVFSVFKIVCVQKTDISFCT